MFRKFVHVRLTVQEMVIFFGSCSGVIFGKLMVRTPFSIEALIASGYGENDEYQSRTELPGNTCLDSRGQLKDTGEFAIAALSDSVTTFLTIRGGGHITRNGETMVVNVDANVLLFQAWEFEGGGDSVRLQILVNIHSVRNE
jgi:hypothetical protein